MSPVPPWIFVLAFVGWLAIIAVVWALMVAAARADRERDRRYGPHQG